MSPTGVPPRPTSRTSTRQATLARGEERLALSLIPNARRTTTQARGTNLTKHRTATEMKRPRPEGPKHKHDSLIPLPPMHRTSNRLAGSRYSTTSLCCCNWERCTQMEVSKPKKGSEAPRTGSDPALMQCFVIRWILWPTVHQPFRKRKRRQTGRSIEPVHRRGVPRLVHQL